MYSRPAVRPTSRPRPGEALGVDHTGLEERPNTAQSFPGPVPRRPVCTTPHVGRGSRDGPDPPTAESLQALLADQIQRPHGTQHVAAVWPSKSPGAHVRCREVAGAERKCAQPAGCGGCLDTAPQSTQTPGSSSPPGAQARDEEEKLGSSQNRIKRGRKTAAVRREQSELNTWLSPPTRGHLAPQALTGSSSSSRAPSGRQAALS